MLLIEKGKVVGRWCRKCAKLHRKPCPKRNLRGIDPWTRRRYTEIMALKAALASVDDVRKLAV